MNILNYMLRAFIRTVFVVFLFQIVACSSTTQAYRETIALAFLTPPDNLLSRQELALRPYDNVYARFDNREQSILTLGYIEKPRLTPEFEGILLPDIYKWVSSDRGLIITQGHRVIKTVGLPIDLWTLSLTNKDPLLQPFDKIRVGQEFQHRSDWSNHQANVTSRHVIRTKKYQILEISGVKHSVVYITEDVIFSNGQKAINEFWFSTKSRMVLKSRQTIAPFFPVIELTYVTQAFREEVKSDKSQTISQDLLSVNSFFSIKGQFNIASRTSTATPIHNYFPLLSLEHGYAKI